MRVITTIVAAVAVIAGAGVAYAVGHTSEAAAQPVADSSANVSAPDAFTAGVKVPNALAVPAKHRLVATAEVVQGSQVYKCDAGTWTLSAPDAVLRSGGNYILHTAGPQWMSASDGSSITGETVASVPRPKAVPELLLAATPKSTPKQGNGLFSHVDFVQRLDTSGGVAPTTACTDGQLQAVDYHATYRFFAPVGK